MHGGKLVQEPQKSILPDHEEQFAQTFEHITDLIDNENWDEVTKALSSLHFADLADFLDNSNYKTQKAILPLITNTIKADTLVSLSNSTKQQVLEILGIEVSSKLIDQLSIEDAIEVIEYVDDEIKSQILEKLSRDKKQQIIEGFTYPENTVGRIIERNFVSFQEHWSVGQAIDSIRHNNIKQDFHAAIIVDNKFKPVGNVLLSTLLKFQRNTPIKQLMNSELRMVDSYTELSEIAFIFKQYALTIVPVVNKSGKLVGSVSIQSMIYIIEEQTERDIMQLSGVHTQDTYDNLFSTAKHRFPWLFVNLITACITSVIINQFSDTIARLITIAAIMPIVASMGGNAGTQAMTVTVRALANKDITHANMFKVIGKEIMVCSLNGSLLASIAGGLSYTMLADFHLSIIFVIAIIINFFAAGFLGSVIPITLYNLDIDPATASGVFLTALTDALGFFMFLVLAYGFLV